MVEDQDSWDPWIAASWRYDRGSYAWSPCGRFIAAGNGEGVGIYDSLSFELLSTLMPIESAQESMDQLAYSMDGRSVASAFGASLIIWDIQTGGVAKEIEYEGTYSASLTWSLNGSTICIISQNVMTGLYAVYIHDVASGVMRSPGILPSVDKPYVWAHNTSFRVMTTAHNGWDCLINIFEVGSVLTWIESFHIEIQRVYSRVGPFSQTTHHISLLVIGGFSIFDARTSRRLLSAGWLRAQCFSPDGSLFAGILADYPGDIIHIWKYNSNEYTSWRKFPLGHLALDRHPLRFSPTLSSLLARSDKFLHLLRLDDPPIVARPDHCMPHIALSRCGSYMVTVYLADSVVTITNLVSQTPRFINTGIYIKTFVLTGNILLVLGYEAIVAWRLTGEGAVDGVFPCRIPDHGDSIWTVSLSGDPTFFVGDETVAIRQGDKVIWTYHIETGEVLEPTKPLIYHHPHYTSQEMLRGLHHHHRHNDLDLVPLATIQTGWAKDPEGKHQLWIPVEWRNFLVNATSSHDSKALRLVLKGGAIILIRF